MATRTALPERLPRRGCRRRTEGTRKTDGSQPADERAALFLSEKQAGCVQCVMSTATVAMPGMPDRMKGTKREASAAADATVEALVMAYSGAMYRVANSVLRNATEAEDAVQEAFLRVLKKREQLAEIRDARVWLVRIVWNIVLDRKRRMKTRPENEDIADFERILTAEGLSAEDLAVSAQRHAAMLRWIDELPTKEREVMMLSALEELSRVEIAAVLRTTESAVRSRLFRARGLMAEKMGRGL